MRIKVSLLLLLVMLVTLLNFDVTAQFGGPIIIVPPAPPIVISPADEEPPVIDTGLGVAYIAAATSRGTPFDYADQVKITDNVGVVESSCTPRSGSVFPIGMTSITCTANDAAGNKAQEGVFTVYVQPTINNLHMFLVTGQGSRTILFSFEVTAGDGSTVKNCNGGTMYEFDYIKRKRGRRVVDASSPGFAFSRETQRCELILDLASLKDGTYQLRAHQRWNQAVEFTIKIPLTLAST